MSTSSPTPRAGPSRSSARKRPLADAYSPSPAAWIDDTEERMPLYDEADDDSADEYVPESATGKKSGARTKTTTPKRSVQRSVRTPRAAAESDSDSDSESGSSSGSTSESGSSEDDSTDDDDDHDDNSSSDQNGPPRRRQPAGRGGRGSIGIDPALLDPLGLTLDGNTEATDQDVDFESESFARLVSSLQDTSRQTGALRKTWDTSIEQETAEFEAELRAAAGFNKKKRVKRTFKEANLSLEVRDLIAQATMLYVDHFLLEAMDKLEEIVRIDPTALQAWHMLGIIHAELGDEEKAIQARIVGAHLQPRAMAEWRDLAYRSYHIGLVRQAVFCLSQAIRLDRTDVNSIWDRATMLRDLGDAKAAANGFFDLLKLLPHDASVVRELVPVLVGLKSYGRAIAVMEEFLEHSKATYPDPTVLDDDPDAPVNQFNVAEIVTLADLLLMDRKPVETIAVVRQTVRWLHGRASETFWDAVDDDREFDEDRNDEFSQSRQQGGYGRMVEMAPPHPIDPEIRLRLGKARMMINDVDEAMRHFELLIEAGPEDAPNILKDVADCLFENKLWDAALDVYQELVSAALTVIDDIEIHAKLAACSHALGRLDSAAQYYEALIEHASDNLEWQMALAEVYEEMGERDKSLETLRTVVRVLQAQKQAEAAEQGRDQDGDAAMAAEAAVGGTQMSFFDELAPQIKPRPAEGRARMNYDREQRLKIERKREEETLLCWRRLELLEGHVFIDGFWRTDVPLTLAEEDDGAGLYGSGESAAERHARYRSTRQWLEEASALVESFRNTKKLHTSKKARSKRGTRPRGRPRILRAPTGSGISRIRSQAQNLLYRLQDSMFEEEIEAEHTEIGAMETSFQKQLDQARFRGIPIEDWVDLFARYAMVLTKIGGEQAMVNEVMQGFLDCNVVKGSYRRTMTVRLAWLSCALYARDYDTIFRCIRWLCQEHQFHDQPIRLLASITNALGQQSLSRFVHNPDVKFYQRRMRQIEAIVHGLTCYFSDKTHHYIIPHHIFLSSTYDDAGDKTGAEAAGEGEGEGGRSGDDAHDDDEDDDDDDMGRDVDENGSPHGGAHPRRGAAAAAAASATDATAAMQVPKGAEPSEALRIRLAKPSKPSPIAETSYGYMLLASGGYQAPGAFFARAFAIQQNDPLICLCAAVAFVGRSTNRQADNRHHLFLQALAFFQLYKRNLGLAVDDDTCQEVEYNHGRLLHHLGLLHLAVPHYERVLALASASRDRRRINGGGSGSDDEAPAVGFAMHREAAFNLSLIYTLNGSPHLAQELHRQWLTIE
ncbi:uncharacterized protein PFL1_03592 [Pseudozyma flocculosa PF-1]|uniref:Related to transcription factor TFIIIC subunit n=2 Tax=Pseudozyma flocculosa TaxID=84751 RepID=A0A5C3F6K8_9BASI|nr:uncharacterized protein PFL1_03592 [Pseudozyma flocculosa PF-1]EPQ28789.1 hypothetical protein PFL1_03592 [Pseudozyma flocculosa PF-1]SPO39425.1 related to transcription factor TFIIIC subunit [Pseudozyma flocculosa]